MLPEWPGLEVIELVERGLTTSTYRGRSTALDRPVLIIALGSGISLESDFASALRKKGRALAKLRDPRIPLVYELRDDARQLLLILEDARAEGYEPCPAGPLETDQAMALGVEVLRALTAAHGAGVLHGELGRHCLLVSPEGNVQVSGFGQEHSKELVSLPESWVPSPEQVRGLELTRATDVFQLGVVLYELCAGESPFGAPDSPDFGARIVSGTFERLAVRTPQIGADFSACIDEMLAPMRSSRPHDLEELSFRLQRWLGKSPSEVLRRWPPAVGEERATPRRPHGRRPFPWPVVALSVGALGAATMMGLRWFKSVDRSGESFGDSSETSSELKGSAPSEYMYLRAVASPWAHVYVDGVHVETTPFAQAIRLTPGTHEIRFEHPQAKPEVRTVSGTQGQNHFLDVMMMVDRKILPETQAAPPPETTP